LQFHFGLHIFAVLLEARVSPSLEMRLQFRLVELDQIYQLDMHLVFVRNLVVLFMHLAQLKRLIDENNSWNADNAPEMIHAHAYILLLPAYVEILETGPGVGED